MKMMLRVKLYLSLLLLILLGSSCQAGPENQASASAQSDPEKVLARWNDTVITRKQVEQAAAEKLEEMKLERLRFEAEQRQERHQLLNQTLEQLVAEKLLEKEAVAQGISREQLIASQVQAQVAPPTVEEVEAFYEQNKARIQGGSKEQVLPHIEQYLVRQKSQQAYSDFLDRLQQKYGVEMDLEPLRLEVSSEGSPSRGPENAPVTIVEFSDFQCPYCSQFVKTLEQVQSKYPEQVRVVFRQFPLNNIHPQAQKAAEASLCAEEQGKFWEMHDLMFADQDGLEVAGLKEKADSLGLNMDSFSECLESGRYAEVVNRDTQAGTELGVTGTPAIFINGRPAAGAVPYQQIAALIDEELAAP